MLLHTWAIRGTKVTPHFDTDFVLCFVRLMYVMNLEKRNNNEELWVYTTDFVWN